MTKVWLQIVEMDDGYGGRDYDVFRVRGDEPPPHEEFEDLEQWFAINHFKLKGGEPVVDAVASLLSDDDLVFVDCVGDEYELHYRCIEKELV